MRWLVETACGYPTYLCDTKMSVGMDGSVMSIKDCGHLCWWIRDEQCCTCLSHMEHRSVCFICQKRVVPAKT